MSVPFSITIFSTTGDPQGIRHVEKSNWSGSGVVFLKEQLEELKSQPGIDRAGVYLLVGDAAEETLYIGEADPVGDRLKQHASKKDGWSWGVYFFDRNHKISKTEVQYLESRLYAIAKGFDRAILLNKNAPNPPSMALAAKATADAFLTDVLMILPMLGINAFTKPKVSDEDGSNDTVLPINNAASDEFDTVVVPAREDGFKQRFLAENCWFSIRINAKHLPKIKYIASYQVAPVGAVTHIAEVDRIEPYQNSGKYIVYFKAAAAEIAPIPRTADSLVNMQSSRYALRSKLMTAKNLDEIWA